MAAEEQENEWDQVQEAYASREQTQRGEQEKADGEQDEGSAQADYSEVVTVSFTNEHVEQSLDLFLDTITPLSNGSNAPFESIASDSHTVSVVASSMSSQEAKDVLTGKLEQASIEIEEDIEQHIDELNSADKTGEWQTYTNSWYGFELELPTAWQVSTQNGTTKVAPSLEGKQAIEYALVKLVHLSRKISAQDIAQAWVRVVRETWAEVRMQPSQQTGRENEQLVHIEGTLLQARMSGMFAVQIYDRLALISGFQIRTERMQRVLPIFHRVLSSFAFIKKVRRQHYIDEDERAYTGYVPVDWVVKAHLRRIPTVERTPLVDFQAVDLTTTGSVAIPPTYEVYSEDALMTRDDVVGYRKAMPSTGFIEELLIPRYQARKAHMQVESIYKCPERSQEINGKQGQGGTLFDVAALQYTYDEAGKMYRERIVLQIMHTPVIATWTVQMVSRYCAPVEYFASLEPFFAGVLEMRHTSEVWKQQERTRVEERLREAQRSLASASAGYIQAMYALSGSAKSIRENLRANIGLARETDTQTRLDEVVSLLHNATMGTDANQSYDPPVDFQIYWQ